ncbi:MULTISPECIES: type II TA system antitoxin MqsA family protein [Colwellia]|uniref:HTH cro/C1-type domain-containing protein n=1 Tax=Colwellia marinimaniae TaxID=1513592 RepID=A0ABQ0MRJ2_9GAMM|nr:MULTISPECIES: type II TA system antitoxin MqsA family protein [Colwellia]GAW94958.1 hypothetical protein MTCD1_00557 [Colwellia marinimaniae]
MNDNNSNQIVMSCECCGSDQVTLDCIDSKFEYKHGRKIVILEVQLPVYSCSECEFEYTAQEAEQIKHNAICKYLDILLPSEVQDIRKKHKLSVKDFSNLTGFGSASITRWESGLLHQSKSNDVLLRLLSDEKIMNRLFSDIRTNISSQPTPKFYYIQLVPTLVEKSRSFQL